MARHGAGSGGNAPKGPKPATRRIAGDREVTVTKERLERAREAMRGSGVDVLLAGPSADLYYLTGYQALPLERLTLLVLPAEGEATLVVPQLEAPRAVASGVGALMEITSWAETQDPFDAVVHALGRTPRTCALQDQLWASSVLQLQARLAGARFVAAGEVLRALRAVKTEDEIDRLRAVGRAIDAVHAQVPALLRAGRSEVEVGRDITELILREHDNVEFVIVASGPNGASPHHETSQRVLQHGDPVVVDIGGRLDGYCSDSTRTYVVGGVPTGFTELFAVLQEAQEAAVAAVRPGVAAQDVDRAARRIIADAGYGDLFVHRTGHGIGIEVHEHPYIVEGNTEPLTPGMAFSVEPGIYVPDRYGSRIEDIVVVTDGGCERLNLRPRELVAGGA